MNLALTEPLHARAGVKFVRAQGRAAGAACRRAARGPLDRPGADDGLPARGPSLAAARRPRRVRPRRDEPLRQPGPVRPRRGPRPLPARRGARRRAGRRGRRRPDLRAAGQGGLPGGLLDRRRGQRPDRGPLRRPLAARPRALPRRHHRRRQALQHRRRPTSPTSARRTPSRWRRSAAWPATSTSRCGSRRCRSCARPTAWR